MWLILSGGVQWGTLARQDRLKKCLRSEGQGSKEPRAAHGEEGVSSAALSHSSMAGVQVATLESMDRHRPGKVQATVEFGRSRLIFTV